MTPRWSFGHDVIYNRNNGNSLLKWEPLYSKHMEDYAKQDTPAVDRTFDFIWQQ